MKKITKKQFFDLWWDEFANKRTDTPQGESDCLLCNGNGLLTDRFGIRHNCICPNGRERKRRTGSS